MSGEFVSRDLLQRKPADLASAAPERGVFDPRPFGEMESEVGSGESLERADRLGHQFGRVSVQNHSSLDQSEQNEEMNMGRAGHLGRNFSQIPIFPTALQHQQESDPRELEQEESFETRTRNSLVSTGGNPPGTKFSLGRIDLPQSPRTEPTAGKESLAGELAQELNRSIGFQSKLSSNGSGHPPEEGKNFSTTSTPPQVQQKCTKCEAEEKTRSQEQDELDSSHLSRKPDLEDRLSRSMAAGQPLPGSVQKFMEPRLGADLSGVRVHTDAEAVQMSRAIGAQAFTHRNHVFFGEGQAPGNDHLTAHELVHTIQQGEGGSIQSSLQTEDEESQVNRTPESLKTSVSEDRSQTDAHPERSNPQEPLPSMRQEPTGIDRDIAQKQQGRQQSASQSLKLKSTSPKQSTAKAQSSANKNSTRSTAKSSGENRAQRKTEITSRQRRSQVNGPKGIVVEAPAISKQEQLSSKGGLRSDKGNGSGPRTDIKAEAAVKGSTPTQPNQESLANIWQDLKQKSGGSKENSNQANIGENQDLKDVLAQAIQQAQQKLDSIPSTKGSQPKNERITISQPEPITRLEKSSPPDQNKSVIASPESVSETGNLPNDQANDHPQKEEQERPVDPKDQQENLDTPSDQLSQDLNPEVPDQAEDPEVQEIGEDPVQVGETAPDLTSEDSVPSKKVPGAESQQSSNDLDLDQHIELKVAADSDVRSGQVIQAFVEIPLEMPSLDPAALIPEWAQEALDSLRGMASGKEAELEGEYNSKDSQVEGIKQDEGSRLDEDKESKHGELTADKEAKGEELDADKQTKGDELETEKQTKGEELESDKQAKAEELQSDQEAKEEEIGSEKQAKAEELETDKQTKVTELEADKQTKGSELKTEVESKGAEVGSECEAKESELRSDAETNAAELEAEQAGLAEETSTKEQEVETGAIQQVTQLKDRAMEAQGEIESRWSALEDTATTEVTSLEARAQQLAQTTMDKARTFLAKVENGSHQQSKGDLKAQWEELKAQAQSEWSTIESQIDPLTQRVDQGWQELNQNWQGTQSEIQELGEQVKASIEESIRSASDYLTERWTLLREKATEKWNTFQEKLGAAQDWLQGRLDAATSWIGERISGATEWLSERVKAAEDWISERVEGGLSWLGEKVDGARTWLEDKVKGANEWLGEKVDGAKSFISDKIGEATSWLTERVTGGFEWMKDKGEAAKNWLFEQGENAVAAIGDKAGSFVDGLIQSGQSAVSSVWSQGGDILEWFQGMIGSLASGIQSKADSVVGWLNDGISGATDWIQRKGSEVWNWLGDQASGAVNWIQEKGSAGLDWLSQRASDVTNWVQEKGSETISWLGEKGSGALDWLQERGSDAINWLGETGSSVKDWLQQKGSDFMGWLEDAGSTVGDWFKEKGSQIFDVLKRVGEFGSNILQGITDAVSRGWDWATTKLADLGQWIGQLIGDGIGWIREKLIEGWKWIGDSWNKLSAFLASTIETIREILDSWINSGADFATENNSGRKSFCGVGEERDAAKDPRFDGLDAAMASDEANTGDPQWDIQQKACIQHDFDLAGLKWYDVCNPKVSEAHQRLADNSTYPKMRCVFRSLAELCPMLPMLALDGGSTVIVVISAKCGVDALSL